MAGAVARRGDLAAMQLDEMPGDGQAEPEPALSSSGGIVVKLIRKKGASTCLACTFGYE